MTNMSKKINAGCSRLFQEAFKLGKTGSVLIDIIQKCSNDHYEKDCRTACKKLQMIWYEKNKN